MAIGSQNDIVGWLSWRPAAMARLCAKAIDLGIEVNYAKHLIKKRKLVPEPSFIQYKEWPWPVKILTFGKFELTVDEHPIVFSRKVQQRPLELLKALIAFGGTAVPETTLTDALWPDAEGDAAHQAFGVTLHRLRN
jgi:LuxR family transcriptional regulator, maltose regulon positive regulatory protein